MSRAYKILPAREWEAALASGSYAGSAVDLRDGFIHLSTAAQVAGTAARHFADQDGLVLLKLETTALGGDLRWEPSRGGELFPHIYGVLATSAVLEVHPFPRDAQGVHAAPEPLRA